MNCKGITIVAVFVLISCTGYGQSTSAKSEKILIDFTNNTPANIQLLKPEFAETRSFKKQVKFNRLDVEGIVSDKEGVGKVFLNDALLEVNDVGYFKTMLILFPGDNELLFKIVDKRGESTSITYYIEFEKPEVISGPGDFFSLIIGINDYDDKSITDLDNPIRDAKALRKVLVQQYSFKEENSELLLNPTRAQIIDGLDALSKKVGKEDNVLIFYAGHGHWDENAEIGYWLPSNARKSSKSAWFRNSTIRDYIKEIDSRNTLIITDACFGGAIFKSRKAFNDASQAINKVYELKSRKAMTSGTLTVVPDNSMFMKYMVKRLESNTEKYLASEQLFASFKEAVINNAVIEDAIPQYGTVHAAGDEGGDFVFIKKGN